MRHRQQVHQRQYHLCAVLLSAELRDGGYRYLHLLPQQKAGAAVIDLKKKDPRARMRPGIFALCKTGDIAN